MTIAYIGVGSNVGGRADFTRSAVTELDDHAGIAVEATSSLYESAPVGGPPQRSFINLVTRVSTGLDARGLLEACQAIEQRVGREPSNIRWGPRVVDLDILLFGDQKINEPDLEIPHSRITARRFVLVPLLELDPDVVDPWEKPYSDWLEQAEGDVEFIEPFA